MFLASSSFASTAKLRMSSLLYALLKIAAFRRSYACFVGRPCLSISSCCSVCGMDATNPLTVSGLMPPSSLNCKPAKSIRLASFFALSTAENPRPLGVLLISAISLVTRLCGMIRTSNGFCMAPITAGSIP